MANIYELTGSLLEIQRLIEDGSEGLEGILETLDLELEDKVEGYAVISKNMAASAEAVDAEIKRLQARKKMFESGSERMRGEIQKAMILAGKDSIKGDKFTISISKRRKMIVDGKAIIPTQFISREVVEKVDNKALKEYLENNKVEGISFVENPSLSIR